MISSRRWSVLGLGVAVVGIGALWWSRQPPPGEWRAKLTLDQKRRAWEQEQEWAAQPFTPIRDDPAFLQAVLNIPVRVETSVKPEQLRALQQILFDQLVCRHTGSLSSYRERFASGQRGPMDELRLLRLEKVYPIILKRELPKEWNAEEEFEKFWNVEYNQGERSRRFEEVALGPAGALLVIGEARSAEYPESALTPEEVNRLQYVPGAGIGMWGSTVFHPGKRNLAAVVEKNGKATYAECLMIVRTSNREIWSWFSNWFWDPLDNQWHVFWSGSATSRRPYNVPT